jgi:hypothetical protein
MDGNVVVEPQELSGLVEVKTPFTVKKWNAVVKWKFSEHFPISRLANSF